MAELFSTFSAETIIIILLVAIPSIIGFIQWCKNLWSKREQFKQENIEKGKALEATAEAEEHRLSDGEAHIKALEEAITAFKTIQENQDKIIQRLQRSDQLAIKTYIKEQHDIWMVKGFIDSQTLDILEQRFEIYEEEGGNSWAKKLMDDLRTLPVAVIPSSKD